jgi:hypothetical protein
MTEALPAPSGCLAHQERRSKDQKLTLSSAGRTCGDPLRTRNRCKPLKASKARRPGGPYQNFELLGREIAFTPVRHGRLLL